LNFPSSKQAEHEKKNAWRQYVFTFGKYKGKTLEYVRVKDLDYVKEVIAKDKDGTILQLAKNDTEVMGMDLYVAINECEECIDYLQKTDPYYTPGFSVKSKYPTKGVVLGN
jgi:hypothetical protein